MKRLAGYLKESRVELTQVSWPTREQAIRLTLLVIVFSIAFGLFTGLLDYAFGYILQKLILKV